MKFLSDILAKAGLTVDGVVTLNNTATGQTPATNDNSTKLATTEFIKNQSYLSANQTITVSGDATGSGTTSIALTLANSGVTAGTYGNASNIPTIVVDAKGRITSISTNAVSIITTLAGLSDVTLTSPSANQVLQYNGTRWVNGAAPTTYSLPIATSSVLGGIKVGTGLSIDPTTGVLTATGGGGGNLNFRTIQEFTSTAGQTTYTISGGYTVGYVEVLVNGVYISENQYTATNGTTIVLSDANSAGDIVTVFLYSLYNLGESNYARNVDTLTATAGQTSFTTSYIPGQIDVYYNGSKLTAAEYTATSGSAIILAQAAKVGDIIEVVTYLAGAGLNASRTLTINGTTYDLTANRTWTLTTANISEVTNLYYTDARARAAISVTGSGSYNSSTGVITVTGGVTSVNTLTGAVTLTTTNIAEGTNLYYTDARVGTYLTTNSYATQTYVGTQIANLVASAPSTLDTLNELAAALGNDPSFATTVATSIGTKVPQTRTITINGTAYDLSADRSWTIASGVTSFNTRTGAITPASGDYTTTLVTEGTNLYYTDVRVRAALSFVAGSGGYNSTTGVINIPTNNTQITNGANYITLTSISSSATGLTYTNTTGVFSLTAGYSIPTTASQTTWDTAYTNRITSLTTTGTSGAATLVGNVLNIPQYQGGVTSFNTRTGAITLTSSDVTTALTYTPVTNARTITINGTTYDLTANRSWTIAPDVSVRNTYAFTATAAQTTFTVSGGYSVGLVDVFINGVKLAAADFTATNGTTVVLATGTGVGNIVEIVKYVSAFTTAVETTRTLTINGTTYDLSANRTWSIDNASLGAQAALNGTGLVRMSGTTVSYDNATYATQSYVTTAVANLVNSAPSTLDTLNELATALGNDANFATTITTSIGTKQAQLNGTGFVKISGTTISYDNSTYLTTSSAASTYLPLAGGTLIGALGGTSASFSANVGAATVSYGSGTSTGALSYGTSLITLEASSVNTTISLRPTGTGGVNTNGFPFTTGALSGTSATFSTASNDQLVINSTNSTGAKEQDIKFTNQGVNKALIRNVAGGNIFDFYSYEYGLYPLRIASTGAATFSSTIAAATESTFTGTSANTRVLITASGVANTVIGFNNSGATTTGVINNAAYVGVLQAYPLIFTIDSVERLRIASTGAATFSSSVTAVGGATIGSLASGSNAILDFATNASGGPRSIIYRAATAFIDITNTAGTAVFQLSNGGAATFSSSVTASGAITVINGVYTLPALTPSYFGYGGYGVLIVGNTNSAQPRSIAFGVDVSGNASGAFSGYGNEYIWRNAGSFITPNAPNTAYNTLFSWNSSGALTINQAATFSSTITAAALSQIGSVYIGGRTGTYAGYADGIFGDNLHLAATTGAVYINTLLNKNTYINPVGGNVGINATSLSSKFVVYEGDIRLWKNHLINQTGTWKSNIIFTDEVDRLGARIVGERTAWDGAPMGLGFDTGGVGTVARRMTIVSGGNIGINTELPKTTLNVQVGTASSYSGNGAGESIRVSTGSTNAWMSCEYNGITAYYGATSGGYVKFAGYNYAAGNSIDMEIGQSAMYIKAAGNVLVNYSSVWNGEKFGIQTSNGAAWASIPSLMRLTNYTSGGITKITFTDSSIIDGWIGMVPITGGSYFAMGFSGYTEQGFKLYQNGNYQFVGTNLSDRRIKSNIQVLDNSLEKVSRLKPSTFSYNDNPTAIRGGFIAQEVDEVFPEFVSKPQYENEMMGVDYNGMIAVLTKAIQELKSEIDILKAR